MARCIEESVYTVGGPGPYFASWPAACGSPRQWGFEGEAEYRLYNTGENGVIRESALVAAGALALAALCGRRRARAH